MTTEEQVSLTVRCGGLNRVANLTAKQSDPSLIDEIRLEYSCRDSSGQMVSYNSFSEQMSVVIKLYIKHACMYNCSSKLYHLVL